MGHVIVDMELSLVSEEFEVRGVTVIEQGRKIKTEMVRLHEKVRKYIRELVTLATEDFRHQLNNALEQGYGDTEFELRRRICVTVEN